MKFRDLEVGQLFDWVDDSRPGFNSFFKECRKLSIRVYEEAHTGIRHLVRSINAPVYHVKNLKHHDSTYLFWLEDLEQATPNVSEYTKHVIDRAYGHSPLMVWERIALRDRWSGRNRNQKGVKS